MDPLHLTCVRSLALVLVPRLSPEDVMGQQLEQTRPPPGLRAASSGVRKSSAALVTGMMNDSPIDVCHGCQGWPRVCCYCWLLFS